MVLTTMSTWLFCSAVMRSADDRMRYSTCDGVPKMSRATSPAMSTSKPVISPVIGSRKLNRLLPMSRPTMSRPRSRIVGDGVVGLGLGGERPQARGQVAVVVGVVRRQRQLGRAAPPCPPASAAASVRVGVGGTGVGAPAARQHGHHGDRDAEHSLIGCSSSRKRSSAVLTQPRPQPQRHRDRRDHAEQHAAPTVAPDSTRRALRMSLRSCSRLSPMPLVSASSSLSKAGVESSSPRAERDLRRGLIVADRDVGVDPVVGRAPAPQQLLGVGQIRLVDRIVAAQVLRQAAAASCRCAGSRTACGRPRRRAGSATASRRRAPAGR